MINTIVNCNLAQLAHLIASIKLFLESYLVGGTNKFVVAIVSLSILNNIVTSCEFYHNVIMVMNKMVI